jgi:hypothetical protein
VKASFSLGRDVTVWSQSTTTRETSCETVIVRQFDQVDNVILANTDPDFDTMNTENNSEMTKEVEDRKSHRMGKVDECLELWQGSHNLHATQKDSHAQNKQVAAVGLILDTEKIVKASWSLFQHDGAAALKLSERLPLLRALSAKDLPGVRTQILNICRIRRVNRHPVESDEYSVPESISDLEDWLNWTGDFDNPNDREDNCAADVESDIEQDTSIEDPQCPDQQDVSTVPNVPRSIWPTRKSKRQGEKLLVTVNANETRRNKRVKK